MPWAGDVDRCPFKDMDWVHQLPKSTYLALYLRLPTFDLPLNKSMYVVSFHLEPVDCDWLDRQAVRLAAPIFVLHDGSYYDWPHASNIIPFTYIFWHRQLDQMIKWFGPIKNIQSNKKYLASAYCSRITQSKLLIFTALAEYVGMDRTILTLHNWLEEKNVHYREPCGNPTLDQLSEIFFSKYFGQIIQHDDYSQSLNYQAYTADYTTPAYQDCVLHFTNESYHYSLMNDHIRPGPFFTEKTLKCLAAGQAFVPVGQFDTYGALTRLGFKFDFGFDTSWDADPGNLSRLQSIVGLIKNLAGMTCEDLVLAVSDSCQYNLDHLASGDFAKICNNVNDQSIQNVLSVV